MIHIPRPQHHPSIAFVMLIGVPRTPLNHLPPIYGLSKRLISRSSCEAEVKATDECVKNVQMFRHVLFDLNLLDSTIPTNVYNDNQGSVNWSNSFSTKGMRHVNIREIAIREARQLNEVSIIHIPGTANPADLFTKEFKSDCTFCYLRDLTLFYPSSFQTD
jgi:hypothetical protein